MKYWGLLLAFCGQFAYADLVLSFSPNLPEAKYKTLLSPISEELSVLLEEKVKLDYSPDWLTYSKRMRSGGFDIVFDDAHFVAWRSIIENMGHKGLVQLSGDLQFGLVALANADFNSVEDFHYKSICARNSPAMETVSMLKLFPNPVNQPFIIEVKQRGLALEKLNKKKCDGALVRLDEVLDNETYKVIKKLDAFPKAALTARSNLPPEIMQKLTEFFTSNEMVQARLNELWHLNDSSVITRYDSQRYKNMDILSGKVWGW